ncbi:MAG: hypothetical protein M1827_001861 [Pycnora praestabilis]|nr:MAG: hypothetical protein M1827_001861 [Pycnora praestabilis]
MRRGFRTPFDRINTDELVLIIIPTDRHEQWIDSTRLEIHMPGAMDYLERASQSWVLNMTIALQDSAVIGMNWVNSCEYIRTLSAVFKQVLRSEVLVSSGFSLAKFLEAGIEKHSNSFPDLHTCVPKALMRFLALEEISRFLDFREGMTTLRSFFNKYGERLVKNTESPECYKYAEAICTLQCSESDRNHMLREFLKGKEKGHRGYREVRPIRIGNRHREYVPNRSVMNKLKEIKDEMRGKSRGIYILEDLDDRSVRSGMLDAPDLSHLNGDFHHGRGVAMVPDFSGESSKFKVVDADEASLLLKHGVAEIDRRNGPVAVRLPGRNSLSRRSREGNLHGMMSRGGLGDYDSFPEDDWGPDHYPFHRRRRGLHGLDDGFTEALYKNDPFFHRRLGMHGPIHGPVLR